MGLKTLLHKSQTNNSDTLLIIIGGSNDTKDKHSNLARTLISNKFAQDILTFSFTGVEEEKDTLLGQQIDDLQNILQHANKELCYKKINLIATSQGAFSTSHIITNSNINKTIQKIVLLDPADYPLTQKNLPLSKAHTWDGSVKFTPTEPTCATLFKNTPSHIAIDVVHLTLKNYGKGNYLEKEYELRGKYASSGYPRLNTKMVQGFYDYTPEVSKGKYLEVDGIPHAFTRDGNVKKNIRVVSELIQNMI